jgi:hypothetical protein
MSKVVFSLFAALSLFAFVSVNGASYTIPALLIDVKTVDFSISAGGIFNEVGNFSLPPAQVRKMSVSSSITKVRNYFSFTGITDDEFINGTDFPLGWYLYRDDVKKLFFYPPVGTGSRGTIHRCEDKGTSSLEQAVTALMKYIDFAATVRNKADKFTEKTPYPEIIPFADIYSYSETKTLTGVQGYDSVTTKHEYYIERQSQLCLRYQVTYTRHSTLTGADVLYATDNFAFTNIYSNPLLTEQDLLESNFAQSKAAHYEYNLAESKFCPNVLAHNEASLVLVCPEIDLIPRPLILNFLTSTNFTEYELILDNPVSVEKLVIDTVKILNLTRTYPERVLFDGIN